MGQRNLRALARLTAPALAASTAVVLAAGGPSAAGAPGGPNRARPGRHVSVFALANRCFAVRAVGAGALPGSPFYLKPTGLGTYLLYDVHARMPAAREGGGLKRTAAAGPRAVFAPLPSAVGNRDFALRSVFTRRRLALAHRTVFAFTPASGCRVFPEAQVGAVVHGPGVRTRGGRIYGFVDDHMHITGNMRAGGDVIYGEPFDRFGIPAALGQDARVHGRNGALDLTGNLLRTGKPTGTHDTHGWPSFTGWPTFASTTHQQAYYVWVERAWRAGMRLMVAQTVDDGALCRIEPRRATRTCSEAASIVAQIHTLKGLQNYVDAQSGGPGRGWFRLVYSPAQARRVMEAGKLAVVIGIESSDLFGCSERHGHAQCTRADINRGLARYRALGVRGMFVAHWLDNAFAGAALEPGVKGIFINLLNRLQTGDYFRTGRCPAAGQGAPVTTLPASVLESLSKFFPATRGIAQAPIPHYPAGLRCNSRRLTPLGRYLVRRMMADHMLIEVDHLSESARDEVLSMAARAHYPLISSHNGTGGTWTAAELAKLYRLGGFAAVTPDEAPVLVQKILAMARFRRPGRFFGVGLGTDTNGFSSLPGPRPDSLESPLRYPFRSFDGSVTFTRERTGTRTFDINRDGVAQYGLLADLVADMARTTSGRRADALLFNSAEAYLEAWQRAFAHR